MEGMMKRVLTIAGSDSGGGAGVQADLKTFMAHGVFGMSVLTAITAQNTMEVRDVYTVPVPMVRAQFEAVAEDIGFDAVKTGMLATMEIVKEVVKLLRQFPPKILVVDPVMVATSGGSLLKDDANDVLKSELLPLATVLTPNIPEASALLDGRRISNYDDARQAAYDLHQLGPKAVLVKGGHFAAEESAVDILYDGAEFHAYSKPWIDTPNTHGTGCTIASAITAQLALGLPIDKAVEKSKNYVYDAMTHAAVIGKGHGPLNHGYAFTKSTQ